MVQRKVANKTGIRPPHLLSLDAQLVNLKPSSETHEKIMKKSRSIKSQPATPQKQSLTNTQRSPNYMKSTSSFEARKEQSPSPKTPIPKVSKTDQSASGIKGSSLKVRTLTRTTSFKPLRSSKKVIICEDADSRRPTCSSTLKDSKFPNYLQLNDGGTSAMKVCPYSYCSLNGHHHPPVPPLKCFLSARRRALKGFKLGCLSPRQIKPTVSAVKIATQMEDKEIFTDIYRVPLPAEMKGRKKSELVIAIPEEVDVEYKDVFYRDDQETQDKISDAKGGQDLECSDIEWEEGYGSDSDQMKKTNVGQLYNQNQDLYDEESMSSGAWSEEAASSDGWCRKMNINQDHMNSDAFEVSSSSTALESDKMHDLHEDQKMNYQEPNTVPDNSMDETQKDRTTIIFNIIQFNVSVFINGEKTEHSGTATSVDADKMKTKEEQEAREVVADEELQMGVQDIATCEKLNEQDNHEQECNEEPAIRSYEIILETYIKPDSLDKKSDEQPDPCVNLRDLTGGKKPGEETGDDDSREFNPRGPNFLPETPDPDAETVDLRHQTMDERKNAEEFMVDFALQQAVTTLAPARKRKVALLVEAFEKVMPDTVPVRIPGYEPHSNHTSKAFTNSRPIQACS